MLKKILNLLREKGLRGFFIANINFFLTKLFGLFIIKVESIAGNAVARKVFSKCNLKYSEDGFYFLDPMPSVSELNQYYKSLYWDSRAGKNYGVNIRDIVHYKILDECIPRVQNQGKVFLNFGAGHGGISNLFWMKGMDIVNVEPSSLPNFYNERWETVEDIYHVPSNSVDLIYGSHSLEHVQDIGKFKAEVARILRTGGFVFWEVPNAEYPNNGAQKRQVDIPHTYYFETKFFENWFSKFLICSGYKQCYKSNVIQDWRTYKDSKGRIIIALGQIN